MIMLGLFVGGCGQVDEKINKNESKSLEQEEITGELHYAFNAQPPTLDPLVTTVTATRDVARHIFESLVVFNYDYEVKPMLAESWEESSDGKMYTFHLREGIKFHNGKEMTADDVVASMNRWKDKSVYAQAFFVGAEFRKEDDYTVSLELENPSVFILPLMASMDQFPVIMPEEVVNAATETGVEEYIGTGPFKFEEWKQDQYILLERYAGYQPVDYPSDGLSGKKEALVEKLYFDIVTDSSTRLTGLQSGEYDVASMIDLDMLEELKRHPDLEPYHSFSEPVGLIFNKFEGLMTDMTLRQAINAALDQDAIGIAANVNKESYRLDSGYMQKEQVEWYSDAGSELYNQKDEEKAKELLERSNYNGETIRLLTTRDYPYIYNSAVVIQSQLTEVGMNVELEVYDWATVVSRRADPSNWEMLVTGLPVTPSPVEGLVFTGKWIDGPNDEKIEELLNGIRTATDIDEAKKLWDELQGYSWEFLPFVKLHDRSALMGARANVEGLTNPFGPGPILWNTRVVE